MHHIGNIYPNIKFLLSYDAIQHKTKYHSNYFFLKYIFMNQNRTRKYCREYSHL